MIHVLGLMLVNVKRLLLLNIQSVVKSLHYKVSLLKEFVNLFTLFQIAVNMIVLIRLVLKLLQLTIHVLLLDSIELLV